MILAAERAALVEDAPLPPELEYAMDAREWGALPASGGLLDQPAYLFRHMKYTLRVFQAVQTKKNYRGKLEDFPRLHQDELRVLLWLAELKAKMENAPD